MQGGFSPVLAFRNLGFRDPWFEAVTLSNLVVGGFRVQDLSTAISCFSLCLETAIGFGDRRKVQHCPIYTET